MPEISQQPTEVDLVGVAGSPFSLVVNIAATDSDDNPIPWGDFSDETVVITGAATGNLPTITNPTSGQLLLSWTAAQTQALAGGPLGWALQVKISSAGPYPLIAGSLAMGAPTAPGASSTASADLTVSVGTATVNVSVAIGGSSSSGGGAVDSVNGQVGIVVLDAADVGADASGAAAAAQAAAEAASDPAGSATAAQSNAESFATTGLAAKVAKAGDTMAGPLVLPGNPSSALQAAPKQYVDAGVAAAAAASDPAGSAATAQSAAEAFASNALATALAGLAPAEAPAAAQGSGLTHSGIGQTVGGVVITAGMRVLDVATGVSSGLFVAAAGAWTRPVDFATGSNAQGKLVDVDAGGVWLCISNSVVTVDTSSQVWTEIDASVIQAGSGLTKTGNTLALALTKALLTATGLTYSDVNADQAGLSAAETARAEGIESTLAAAIAAILPGLNLGWGGVQTAAFNLTGGKYYSINSTSALATIVGTLPTAPPNLTTISAKITSLGAFGGQLACGGTDVINKTGGSAVYNLAVSGQSVILQYNNAAATGLGFGVWTVLADDIPASQVVLTNGANPMTGPLLMGGKKIENLGNGVLATDAAAFGQLPPSRPAYGGATFIGHSYFTNGTYQPALAARSMMSKLTAIAGIPPFNLNLYVQAGGYLCIPVTNPYSCDWASISQRLVPMGSSSLNAPDGDSYGFFPFLFGSTQDAGLVVWVIGLNDAFQAPFSTGIYVAWVHSMRLELARSLAGYLAPWTDSTFSFSNGATPTTAWASTPSGTGAGLSGPLNSGPSFNQIIPSSTPGTAPTFTLTLPPDIPAGWYDIQMLCPSAADASGATVSWSGTASGAATITPSASDTYTASGSGNGPFTVTRTTAHGNFVTDGAIVGTGFACSGGTANNKIIGVTATTLTLLYSAGTPGTVTGVTIGATATTVGGQGPVVAQALGGTVAAYPVGVMERFYCTAADAGKTIIGTLNYAGSQVTTTSTITGVSYTGSTVTITAANSYSAGQSVLIEGILSTGGAFSATALQVLLNGKEFTVSAAGLSSSQFEITASNTPTDVYSSGGTGSPPFYFGVDSWCFEAPLANQGPKVWANIPRFTYALGRDVQADPITVVPAMNALTAAVLNEFNGTQSNGPPTNTNVVLADLDTLWYNTSAVLTSAISSTSATTISVTTNGTDFNPGPSNAAYGGSAFRIGVAIAGAAPEDMWVTNVAPAGGSSWSGTGPIPAGATLTLTVVRAVNNSTAKTFVTANSWVSDESWMWNDDTHANPEGAAVIANAVFDALVTVPSATTTIGESQASSTWTMGRSQPVQGVVSGYNLYLPGVTPATIQLVNEQFYCAPIYIPQRCTLLDLGVHLTAKGAGLWTMFFGIYFPDGTGGRPGTPLTTFNGATILDANSVAGENTILTNSGSGGTGTPVTRMIEPGTYWVGVGAQGGSSRPTLEGVTQVLTPGPIMVPSGTDFSAANINGFYQSSLTAAPSTAASWQSGGFLGTVLTGIMPRIYLKLSSGYLDAGTL